MISQTEPRANGVSLRTRWFALAAGCSLGLLGAARSACASTTAKAVLDVERPAGTEDCADRASLEASVTARLGRNVFGSPETADLRVTLRYSRTNAAVWHARLSVDTKSGYARGERELTTAAGHCSALDDSLALVLALMLDVSKEEIQADEQQSAPRAESGESSPAQPSLRPEPVTHPIRLPQSTATPRAPWRFALGAAVQGALGNLPNPALGASLIALVKPPSPYFFGVEIGAWLPQSVDAPAGASAQLRSGAAALHTCRRWGRSVSGALCVSQRVSAINAHGSGFSANQNQWRAIYALGMRGQFAVDWGWTEPAFGLELDVPVSRGQFYYARADNTPAVLFNAAPVFITATLGLTFDL